MKVRNKAKRRKFAANAKRPNPLRVDPTRTATLRRQFEAKIRRQFSSLKARIIRLVEGEDALALKAPAVNTRWRFNASDEKLRAFREWLRREFGDLLTGADEEQLWRLYVEAGYRKGAGRAFDDTRGVTGPWQGSRDEFLRQAFGRPVAIEKVKLLASRTFEDLVNVTADMSTRMGRVLADGLVTGAGPREVARQLVKEVGLGQNRAMVIARTECLPADTLVDSAVVRAVFRRWYEGNLVEIVTRNGRKFSATPNHPMLTQNGWVAAGELKVGDNLVCDARKQDAGAAGDQDVQRRPALIGEIFDSLRAVGVFERRRTGEPDFHGDGLDGEVEVFSTDRPLRIGDFATLGKPLAERIFTPSGLVGSGFCPSCMRLLPVDQRACLCNVSQGNAAFTQPSFDGVTVGAEIGRDGNERLASLVTAGDLGGVDVIPQLVWDAASCPRIQLPIRDGSGYAGLSQNLSDLFLVGADPLGHLPLSEPGEVEIDDVLSVRVRPFAGHVYNLETPFGYYTIDGMYTGNCIRAHAEGQLDALQDLGVDEIGVMVEWTTTKGGGGRAGACELCGPMQGVVLKIDEARGMIPRHPNCRCAFLPSNVGESRLGQARGKGAIDKAIRQSEALAGDEWGPAEEISSRRPQAVVNAIDTLSRFLAEGFDFTDYGDPDEAAELIGEILVDLAGDDAAELDFTDSAEILALNYTPVRDAHGRFATTAGAGGGTTKTSKAAKVPKASKEESYKAARKLAEDVRAGKGGVRKLPEALAKLTVPQLKQLKTELGVKGGKTKGEHVTKTVEAVKAARKEGQAKAKGETKPEAKTKPEVKPAAKPAKKPEAKPEAKPDTKAAAKTEPKSPAKPAEKPATADPAKAAVAKWEKATPEQLNAASAIGHHAKGYKQLKTVAEAEEYARTHLKITEVKLGNDMATNNHTLAGLHALREMGFRLPPSIETTPPTRANDGRVGSAGEGRVSMNPRRLMEAARGQASEHELGRSPRWLSTNDPHHFVVHEVGHYLHEAGGGYRNSSGKEAAFRAALPKLHDVSDYGRTEHREFVAEVFAGRTLGRRFSRETMALYQQMGGPTHHSWRD